MDDLQDGGLYVASGGERFKTTDYIKSDGTMTGRCMEFVRGETRSVKSIESARGETRARRHINTSSGGLLTYTDDEREAIASDNIFGPVVFNSL
jgi:hypothetical protein